METKTEKKVPVIINRTKYEVDEGAMTGREILAVAGFGTDYDLFLLQGEGDPSGGRQIGPDESVDIKPGLHFRAIPGNRTFGGW
jgi:hypothetical protein